MKTMNGLTVSRRDWRRPRFYDINLYMNDRPYNLVLSFLLLLPHPFRSREDIFPLRTDLFLSEASLHSAGSPRPYTGVQHASEGLLEGIRMRIYALILLE